MGNSLTVRYILIFSKYYLGLYGFASPRYRCTDDADTVAINSAEHNKCKVWNRMAWQNMKQSANALQGNLTDGNICQSETTRENQDKHAASEFRHDIPEMGIGKCRPKT